MIWNFLINLLIAFVLNVVAYVIAPKPKKSRPQITDQTRDLEAPTADTGRPIPVAFGTVNVLAPNVLFTTDKHAVQFTEYQKNPNLVAYYMSVHYGICQGPVDFLHRIRIREKTAYGNTAAHAGRIQNIRLSNSFSRTIYQTYFHGGVDREGGVVGRMLFHPGGLEETTIPTLLVEKYGDLADRLPAYRGVCYALFTNLAQPFSPIVFTKDQTPVRPPDGGFYWGVNSPFVHPADFMVTRIPRGWQEHEAEIPSRLTEIIEEQINELRDAEDSDDDNKDTAPPRTVRYAVGPDANPAHIIRECQLNEVWGGGLPEQVLDDVAYREASKLFWDEKFGLSELWVRQATIGDFVNDVLDQCETMLYVSPRTGRFVLRPIRGGYDVSTLIHFQDINSKVLSFARKAFGEVPNEIAVSWTSPLTEKEESVTLQNLAGIVQARGEIISDTRTYAGIRYSDVAWAAAERELASISEGLAAAEIETDRSAWDVSPGDVVRLTALEHAAEDVPMRVLNADYGRPGDSAVTLKLIEDIFGRRAPDWEAPAQGAVPGIPRNFNLTAQPSAVLLAWDAPLNIGASPISHYEYQRDGGPWRKVVGGGDARRVLVRGLIDGTRYSFRLRAVNKAGPGFPTVPLFIGASNVPVNTPGVPQDFGLRFVNSEVELYWNPPLTDGGSTILRYEVYVEDTTDKLAVVLKNWEALPEEANQNLYHRLTGLVIGRRYLFQLRAVNSSGPGVATHAIELEYRPDAEGMAQPPDPVGFSARGGINSVGLWWDNPFIYYANHERTLIFRGDTNNYANAIEIGFDVGISYYDTTVKPDSEYYYWIIWKSTSGRLSNPVGPEHVRTREDPATAIIELSRIIFDDPLTKELLAPIDRPSSPISAAALFSNLQTKMALDILGLVDSNSIKRDEAEVTAREGLVTRITNVEGTITAEAIKIVALESRITTLEGDTATATALETLTTRVTTVEGRVTAESIKLTSLESRITTLEGNTATATALETLTTRVTTAEGTIRAEAAKVVALQTAIGGFTATAFNRLLTRVIKTETSITTTAQELTALEASIGGRQLGPEQNTFTGATRAAAQRARNTYQSTRAAWLRAYDADNDINIELIWGVNYVYQRRVGGAWVDNGEVLARAAAVAMLNTMVVQHGQDITAISASVTSLETKVTGAIAAAEARLTASITTVDGKVTAESKRITNLLTQVAGLPTVQAFMELSTRVTTNTGGLARWLVKTRVGDLVGGVGLYNDGTNTRFYVQANRFAVYSSSFSRANDIVPFVVSEGKVYIDIALIRDATINTAHIESAFLDNLVARHGTLDFARINKGNIFDLTVGNVIQSTNYSATEGWRIEKAGNAFFRNADFRGTVRSSNYVARTRGWALFNDGTADLQSILADVQNVDILWRGSHWAGDGASASRLSFALPGSGVVGNFNFIAGICTIDWGSSSMTRMFVVPVSLIGTTSGSAAREINRSSTGRRSSLQMWRSASGRSLYIDGVGNNRAWVFGVWGVRNPGGAFTPPTPTPPTPTPTPPTPTPPTPTPPTPTPTPPTPTPPTPTPTPPTPTPPTPTPPTPTSTLAAPGWDGNGFRNFGGSLYASFQDVTGATTYQTEFSTDRNFGTVSFTENSGSSFAFWQSTDLPAPQDGTSYYARARAGDGSTYGPWNAVQGPVVYDDES